MYWNYRIVNVKSQNGGDDWYALQEVSYEDDGTPTGYGDPCMGSETYEDVVEVFKKMITEATNKPPLQEEDFK